MYSTGTYSRNYEELNYDAECCATECLIINRKIKVMFSHVYLCHTWGGVFLVPGPFRGYGH